MHAGYKWVKKSARIFHFNAGIIVKIRAQDFIPEVFYPSFCLRPCLFCRTSPKPGTTQNVVRKTLITPDVNRRTRLLFWNCIQRVLHLMLSWFNIYDTCKHMDVYGHTINHVLHRLFVVVVVNDRVWNLFVSTTNLKEWHGMTKNDFSLTTTNKKICRFGNSSSSSSIPTREHILCHDKNIAIKIY